MDYAALFPWAKKYLLKEVSVYSSHLRLKELCESCSLSKGEENLIKIGVCSEGKLVCNDESGDPLGPFYFVYDMFFMKLGLHLPLDLFVKEILTELNVSPANCT